jgi:hypothetical protein
MSTTSQPVTPSSTFLSIFDTALGEYRKKTGQDLQSHPFANQLDTCDSADAILAVLQQQVDALNEAGKSFQTLMKCLKPTVNFLLLFIGTVGEGVGAVCLSAWVLSLSSFSIT